MFPSRVLAAAEQAAAQGGFSKWLNSETGPKTTHFW